MLRVLHLTLKRKYFDQIASGEKKEEYREIKMYWATRLTTGFPNTYGIDLINPDFKEFDYIHFSDGYNRTSRKINVEWKGCKIKEGKPEWGAELGKKYYTIQLGEIIPI